MTSPAASRRPTLRLPRLRPVVGTAQPMPARAASAVSLVAGLRALLDRHWAGRHHERLVLFLPMLILPMAGGPGDLLLLALLYLVVSGLEAALWPVGERIDERIGRALGAGVWLVAALVLGGGAALGLGLFILVRTIEARVPEALWPIGAALAVLASVLLLDLALVTLGLERGSLWLALAAAIGLAAAAARRLRHVASPPPSAGLGAQGGSAGGRALLEAVLLGAFVLVLALYGALLAHEPALRQLAGTGHFLALPLLAAALVRLAGLALAPVRVAGADPVAVLLLAAWAMAGLVLGGA